MPMSARTALSSLRIQVSSLSKLMIRLVVCGSSSGCRRVSGSLRGGGVLWRLRRNWRAGGAAYLCAVSLGVELERI